jgi:hypothetical protein
MYRDEQFRARSPRNGDTAAQWDKYVPIARQSNPLSPQGLNGLANLPGHGEGDPFLKYATDAYGTRVNATMARIDDHQGPFGRLSGRFQDNFLRRPGHLFGWWSDGSQKSLARDILYIDDQTRPISLPRGQHEGFTDSTRRAQIQDNARFTRLVLAIAQTGDQATIPPCRRRRNLPPDIRQIQDNTIGIRQGKNCEFDVRCQIQNNPCFAFMNTNPDIPGNDFRAGAAYRCPTKATDEA